MDLRQRLARCAVRRAHVLLVEVPGWWTTRLAVERTMLARGWRPALSPADADLLVVCGRPDDALSTAVDRVWEQMPGPRARAAVVGSAVGAALDEAAAELVDDDRQRDDARTRPNPEPIEDRRSTDDDGEHGMAPAGIPLAEGADDRDGLEMDVVHVPLGPVLPHWPAGLVMRCVLHGDVVDEAAVEVLGGRGLPPPPAAGSLPLHDAATACDGAARLLAVAGWDTAASQARRVRDMVLDSGGSSAEQAAGQVARLRSRVARSRSLRWILRDLGVVDESTVRALGLPADARGDVHDRLLALLGRAVAVLRGDPVEPGGDPSAVVAALPRAVAGLEVGAVRLVVASMNPDTAGVLRQERARA